MSSVARSVPTRSSSLAAAIALLALSPNEAVAQRTNENALRTAQDAFGTSIGSESIGLYSPDNVRGFSPFAAGNVRLEGLYFDAVSGFSPRIVQGSNVRVGISALGYPFPAPTGIADYRLRLPGDQAVVSIAATGESLGSVRTEIDAQLPLTGRLSLGAGGHIGHDVAIWGDSAIHASAGATLRWRPSDSLEVIPFWSTLIHRSEDTQPRFIVGGNFLPPRIDRVRNIAQPWALLDAQDVNYGVVARWSPGSLAVAGGVFRSFFHSQQSFSDQFLNVSSEGLAGRHRIVATPDQKFASTSGELRASRMIDDGDRRHIVHAMVRGRSQDRRYGGSDAFELGPDAIDDPRVAPEPRPIFGAQSHDRVRQTSFGAGYDGRWADIGELNIGVQRTDYRKESELPGRAAPVTDVSHWLYNVSGAAYLSPRLAFYGGFTRGLEESPVAPDTAANRDEAPPAIITQQYDAGLRWTIAEGTRLVAGLFNLEKPYFNLDSSRIYRRLGDVRHRGAEISFTSQVTSNLSLVAGAVLLDARVEGEEAAAGLIGRRPVGSTGRTILLSTEYRLPQMPGLSVDLALNNHAERVANTANKLIVPSATNVNLGVRYQWRMGSTPVTLRMQMLNVFNAYVWEVRASDTFFYNAPRHISIRLTADL